MSTKVKVIQTDIVTHEESGREFETSHKPIDYEEPLVTILPNSIAVIGYLSHDSDTSNPLEACDGVGKIYRAYRDAGAVEKATYAEILAGSNSYGVLLDVYIHSGESWRVHGSGKFFPDEQWDVSSCAGVWVPDPYCKTHIETTAAEKVLGVQIEERYNQKKKKYSFVLPNGDASSNFKSAYNAARAIARKLKIATNDWLPLFKTAAREEAMTCANQAVEEYNKWLAGDCYGVVVEAFDFENNQLSDYYNACWGFLGSDYAKEHLKEEFDAMVSDLASKQETSNEPQETSTQ